MKKTITFLLLLCSITIVAQSKPYYISGTVVSKIDQKPLSDATVYLERAKDSTLITYTITDKNGKFELEGRTSWTDFSLNVSYIGYEPHNQNIDYKGTPINLNTISLANANVLDEVIIKSRSPITIKKDTLEFNVSSFKTKKDASVEDLIRELPGFEVDESGQITHNGKPINKILVNGKPFFGNDPTITTRNLTKDIIEKIQVTDTKTKSQAFTGEESTSDDKTINLTIKKENNKGIFGRISAGAGTDKRWEGAGMLNYFNNDRRISVLAGGNNINSPGFSFGEIEKMFGGGNTTFRVSNGGQTSFSIGGRSFGGGQGITTSKNTGFNYADKLSKKVDVSADYFYSNSNSEDESSKERENILPDRRYFSNSNSAATNQSESHSANLEFEINIDTTLYINIQPSFGFSTNKRKYEEYEGTRDEIQSLTNESTTNSFVESSANSFENEFSITKKFGSKGSFLKFELDNQFNSSKSDDFLSSETEIYGDTPETILRNQFTDGSNDNSSFGTELTYRLPLMGKTFYIDFQHEYSRDKRENVRSTYDFNQIDQDFTDFNTELSTNYQYLNKTSDQGIRLNYRKDKIYFNLRGSHVYRVLENKDLLRPELDLKRNFNTFRASSRFRYQFSSKKSFGLRYNLRSRVPALSQLQPFVDISNPLNTRIGNPNLVPSNEHSLNMNFNSFDFQKGTGFYSYLWSNYTNNEVVSKTTIDNNNIRTTTYTNVDGNYYVGGGAFFNKSVKIDSVKTIKFGLGTNISTNKQYSFNNDVKYATTNTSFSPTLSLTFDWRDVLEIRPDYRLSFNNTSYDIENFDNREFTTHNLRISTRTNVPKNLEWENVVNFNYNPNIADGFQKSAWFWNSTISYSILKDKGIISLKAFDLLNQNTNARRVSNENYIEDSQSMVLQRYFMVGFSYKFNTLGKAGEIRKGRRYRMF
ncbi:TonB-dependent receptor [Aureibaculum marinum]|uniref:TonB-dependent receptor n=1 Tax=Aureibaculum marinum TaxID=2487930 RepID=A0A3N4NED9_9FLAO|nr:outer membrane beta-barrel protein [Aureibaculum marinum]RPD91786.1 TonB-dependent receptor [Aureibaculum marinum]